MRLNRRSLWLAIALFVICALLRCGLLKRQGITALLVTHDQHEAFALADEIGVMRAGCIVQWDSAYNLYHRRGRHFAPPPDSLCSPHP